MGISRAYIIEKVKARIDELAPSGDASIVFPVNNLLRPIETLIDSELDNATKELLLRAPLYLLQARKHSLRSLSFSPDNIGYINMPSDFLRLSMLWLRGWERPVTEEISKENPSYKLQRNKFTRGKSAKPVVVLTDFNPHLKARWQNYICQNYILGAAWANNTYEIATSFTIGSNSYSLLDSVGSFPALAMVELQRLNEAERVARRDALYDYLTNEYAQDVTLLLDGNTPDRRVNAASCPVGANLATVILENDTPGWGSLSGGGIYNIGHNVTVEAIPNSRYLFVGWYEGGTLLTTNPTYTFLAEGDRTLKGVFEASPIPVYTVTLLSEDESRGTVAGGGDAEEGNAVAVLASPGRGFIFDAWYYNGAIRRPDIPQSGSFTPTENCTLVARFIQQFEVYVHSENPNNGTVSGGGTVNAGSNVTVGASPAKEFIFDAWYYNGAIRRPDIPQSGSFTPTENCTLVARFIENAKFTVTVVSEDINTGTVEGGGTVYQGDAVAIYATPRPNYVFDGWYIQGTNTKISSKASDIYSPTSNITLEARFYIVYPTIYVYGGGYDTANIGENHKYYGYAYINEPAGCSITANCYLQIGNQFHEFSATISGGDTRSDEKLVFEAVNDPDLNDSGCVDVSIDVCGYNPVVAVPGSLPK